MQMQQDWDGSPLRAYLLRDYWTPDGGLCLLAGFDYAARIESAPFQPKWMHTLSPATLQGHYGQEADEVDDLLSRMNSDLDELRIIWAGCKRDSEAEDYSPTFFIEWASSKDYRPDWLDWAIERRLHIPKQEADDTSQSDFDKASPTYPRDLAIDLQAGAGGTGAVSNVPGLGMPESPETPWHLLATPSELIAVFGTITDMDKGWFNNAKDAPKLKDALHTAGKGGRKGREPLYRVFEVMLWLIDKKRRKGKPIEEATGWRMLKNQFPKVYEEYQSYEPEPD